MVGYEGAPPVATIESVNPSTTKFKIACPTGTDSNDCGLGPGIDYTVLSGTRYQAQMTYPGFSMSLGCDYNSKAVQMTCTVDQQGGNEMTSLGPQTAILSGTDVVFDTATVIEGASLLSGGGASATSLPKSTSVSASSGLMVATGSAPPPSQASGVSASPTSGTQPTPQATGAAVKFGVEGAALLAMAGAVVMNI
ncbi:hypothetical protein T440DRAFT_471594 [Plenodomus tracheiphilus IPT5]|uniref:Uncharacterized protein n=1 Tax=Plenodomus tracheiphilus IPT5 TaxID=1408161 RepID=A0A6A7ATW0_9PLEO|nr:hypothetical protein T440DRAFT_471594 [Plenodomus tracheiphilus IPT5]